MLPFDKYRIPMIKGPYTFIVTSRGCTAGCKYCIKHVSYQFSIRVRTPENIMKELRVLRDLGIKHVNMYADLFTVNREQVMGLCKLLIEEKLGLTWTCNSRVDYVDEEMLQLMGKSGCIYIAWGIESSNEQILKKAAKGYRLGAGAARAQVGARGRHQELGLLHHRPARRDGRDHQGHDQVCQGAAVGYRACSTSPRPIRARPSSSKCWKTTGSGPARSGNKWTWTSPRCWTIRA